MTGIELWVSAVGALFFGFVIGWVTYRTIAFKKEGAKIEDITAVIGAVGGAGVTALFKSPILFGFYCIGLFIGFISFFVICLFPRGQAFMMRMMHGPGGQQQG